MSIRCFSILIELRQLIFLIRLFYFQLSILFHFVVGITNRTKKKYKVQKRGECVYMKKKKKKRKEDSECSMFLSCLEW